MIQSSLRETIQYAAVPDHGHMPILWNGINSMTLNKRFLIVNRDQLLGLIWLTFKPDEIRGILQGILLRKSRSVKIPNTSPPF